MTTQTISPPEKLSDLILLAIKDARSLDRSIYLPDYRTWHQSIPTTPLGQPVVYCYVCLAGAVIAQTLGYPSSVGIAPLQCGLQWERRLTALDKIREGRYKVAYALLHFDLTNQQINDVFTEDRYPLPLYGKFVEWDNFESHLTSLEEVARLMAADGH